MTKTKFSLNDKIWIGIAFLYGFMCLVFFVNTVTSIIATANVLLAVYILKVKTDEFRFNRKYIRNRAFQKIVKCTNSCTTIVQLESCLAMLRNFDNMFTISIGDYHLLHKYIINKEQLLLRNNY